MSEENIRFREYAHGSVSMPHLVGDIGVERVRVQVGIDATEAPTQLGKLVGVECVARIPVSESKDRVCLVQQARAFEAGLRAVQLRGSKRRLWRFCPRSAPVRMNLDRVR